MHPGFAAYAPQALRQNVLPWVALAGIVAAIEARRRAVHAALDRERLRAQVAEQRLIALTGQLHPHFLFNTLQGISTLIHRDPEAADEMLAKLSDLLRDLLRHRDHVLVPLGDELRYARTYLEIAQLRFADRLQFRDRRRSGAGSGVGPAVHPAAAGGECARAWDRRARARRARHRDGVRAMAIACASRSPMTAPGLTTSATLREGIGLSNTRERLRASFGDDQHFSLERRTDGGAVARIDIPFRLHEAPVERHDAPFASLRSTTSRSRASA